MAVSEWSLLALGFALTVACCMAAGALRGRGRRPASVWCLAPGAPVTPPVVFGGLPLAGSVVTSCFDSTGWYHGSPRHRVLARGSVVRGRRKAYRLLLGVCA